MIDFILHIATLILIYALLAGSLNIALGYTGMINLAHIGFFGIGAYTSALLTKEGMSFFVVILIAGALASVFGFIVTVVTNRLKGDYFALGTLGFGFLTYSILLNWTAVTRGPLGIPGIPRPELFGIVFRSNLMYLIIVALIVGLSYFFLYRMTNSRYGRLLEAVRDDSIGLSSLGKNVSKLKAEAMIVSAFFAGVSGSLLAHFVRYIDPSTFFLADIILALTIVIVGGLASLRGSFVAAIIIMLIPELLRLLGLPNSIVGPMRHMVYAVILLTILLYRPRGIFGKVDLQ